MTGGWDQATWKRVESEDELRVGITVKVVECLWCQQTHYPMLTERTPAEMVMRMPDGSVRAARSKYGWRLLGHCQTKKIQFGGTIREGRLYRLVDTTPAEETTTTTRELEKVTG